MGLATAHRLLEFEDGLGIAPSEALQPLAQQRLHAGGHIVFAEELGGVLRCLVDGLNFFIGAFEGELRSLDPRRAASNVDSANITNNTRPLPGRAASAE